MPDAFTDGFFLWLEASGIKVPEVAKQLNKEPQTVYNSRSKGIPKAQYVACTSVMEAHRKPSLEDINDRLTMYPSRDQFRNWNKAANAEGKLIEDWALDGLDAMAAEYFGEAQEPSDIVEFPFVGAAAAGQPVEAPRDGALEVASSLSPDNHVIYEICGDSGLPEFKDGEKWLVETFPGETRTAKKGKPAIFRDAQGAYLKIYDGYNKPLRSVNPKSDDVVPLEGMKLVGYPVQRVD